MFSAQNEIGSTQQFDENKNEMYLEECLVVLNLVK